MRSRIVHSAIAAAMAMLAGCATVPAEERAAQLVAQLTPAHFENTAVVEDDFLDVQATISTEPGFTERRGLLGIAWNDNFLRAYVDKRSGETRVQVYQFIMYQGDWRFYETVNYETETGPVQQELRSVSRDVVSCDARRNSCTYFESFVFEVPESLIRTIAESYQPGEMIAWRFKFGAQRYEDWQDGMLPAEAAGFIAALDAYRAGLTGTPRSNSAE